MKIFTILTILHVLNGITIYLHTIQIKKKTHNKNRPMITYSKKDWQKKTQFQMQKVVSKKQYFGEHSKKKTKIIHLKCKNNDKDKNQKAKMISTEISNQKHKITISFWSNRLQVFGNILSTAFAMRQIFDIGLVLFIYNWKILTKNSESIFQIVICDCLIFRRYSAHCELLTWLFYKFSHD